MWDEGDCGLVVCEHDADLVVQPVAGEWCVLQACRIVSKGLSRYEQPAPTLVI